MQFGFTLKPEHTLERTLALTRQAEAAGFEYGWLFDSQSIPAAPGSIRRSQCAQARVCG